MHTQSSHCKPSSLTQQPKQSSKTLHPVTSSLMAPSSFREKAFKALKELLPATSKSHPPLTPRLSSFGTDPTTWNVLVHMCHFSLWSSPGLCSRTTSQRSCPGDTVPQQPTTSLPLTFFCVTLSLTVLRSTYQLTHYSPGNEREHDLFKSRNNSAAQSGTETREAGDLSREDSHEK